MVKYGKFVQHKENRHAAGVSKLSFRKEIGSGKECIFYALWAGKFFIYARKKQINSDEYQENAVIEFIETLKSATNISDWQIRQAHDAIRLYYFHHRGLKPNNLPTIKSAEFAPELLQETQRLIRLKHYSYSTERTYLQPNSGDAILHSVSPLGRALRENWGRFVF